MTARRRVAALGILLLFALGQPGFSCGMECLYHAVPDGSSSHMVHADRAACHGVALTHVPVPTISVGMLPPLPGLSGPPPARVDGRTPNPTPHVSFYSDRDTPPPRA